MKALVVKTFRDTRTKAIRRKGKIIEVTEERFEEINSTALGVFVVAVGIDMGKQEPSTVEPSPAGEPPADTGQAEDQAPKEQPAAEKPPPQPEKKTRERGKRNAK